jgi:hypothetical protein
MTDPKTVQRPADASTFNLRSENCGGKLDIAPIRAAYGETTHGYFGDPKFGMRVQAETPEPPACDRLIPEFAPASRKGGCVGKERNRQNLYLSGVRPIPIK